MKPDICIYHGNCADGFTSAWAVSRRFEGVEYVAGVYGEAPPDVAGKRVVIVDFSYKRPILQEMAKKAKSILILDHHKTAKDDLAPGAGFVDLTSYSGLIDWKRYCANIEHDGMENAGCVIYTLFDMERSGAGIAWDFFHPDEVRSRLVDYVEDRDLWRFSLYGSRSANAFIFAHEYTFENWDALHRKFNSSDLDVVIQSGAAIERKHHKDVAELVGALRQEMVIGGKWVPVANIPYTLTSDAGHLMCKPYQSPNLQGEIVTPPFAACYWDTPKGRVFSLRSDDEHGAEDVSAIAKGYGGGGHKNASGFQMPHGWSGDKA